MYYLPGNELPAEPQRGFRRHQGIVPGQPAAAAAGNVEQYDRLALNSPLGDRILQACDRYSRGRFYVYSLECQEHIGGLLGSGVAGDQNVTMTFGKRIVNSTPCSVRRRPVGQL